MAKLSFPEKNNLIVQHKNKELFHKDVILFRKHFPHHKLNNQLASVNQFNQERLDGLMISELLDVVSIEEILKNRDFDETSIVSDSRSEEEIKELLVSEFEFDEKDLQALSLIIPLWVNSSDKDIILAVKKMLVQPSAQENPSEGKLVDTADPVVENPSEGETVDAADPVAENPSESETVDTADPVVENPSEGETVDTADPVVENPSEGETTKSVEEKPANAKKKGKNKTNSPE